MLALPEMPYLSEPVERWHGARGTVVTANKQSAYLTSHVSPTPRSLKPEKLAVSSAPYGPHGLQGGSKASLARGLLN